MCSLINKQLLLTAYAYLFIMEQQKGQQGSEALQLEMNGTGGDAALDRLLSGFSSPVGKSEFALQRKFEELHANFVNFLQKEAEEDAQKEGLAFVIRASLGLQACAKHIGATKLAVEIERRAFLHFLRLEKKDTFDEKMEADFDDEFKGFSCTRINSECHHFKGKPTYWAIMVDEFRAAQKKVTEVIPQQQQKADPPGSAIGPIVQLKQFTFYCPDPENNKGDLVGLNGYGSFGPPELVQKF